MRDADRTTRERIADHLAAEPATPRALAAEFAIPADQAVDHVRHLAESLPDGALLVAPPECRECGFDGFDDPANRPSRCPECKNERVAEPRFAIERD